MRLLKYVLFLIALATLSVAIFLAVKHIFSSKENAIVSQPAAAMPAKSESIAAKIIPAQPISSPEIPKAESRTDKLRLLGVMIGNETYAFISDLASDQQKVYRVGETVAGFKILEILSSRITLADGQGTKVTLPIYQASEASLNNAIVKIDEETRQISRTAMAKELSTMDVGRMINELEINPQFDGATNKIIGFQVTKIPEKSLMEQAGLKNSDIVVAVNNEKVESLQKGLEIYNRLQSAGNGSEVEVTIMRDKQNVSLKYRIEQ